MSQLLQSFNAAEVEADCSGDMFCLFVSFWLLL